MEDYHDAASRHFSDANLLHKQAPPRLANASHLYGFAGECALKAIMAGKSGTGKVQHTHLPKIFSEFQSHSVLRGNSKLLARFKACCVGLNSWKVEERYHHQNSISFSEGRVQSEHEAAERLLGLLHLWKKGAI